jgi:hypothetical protein
MEPRKILFLLAAALLVAAGCSQRSGRLQVSARGAASPAAAAAGPLQVNENLSIDRVRVAVKELDLEDGSCTPASGPEGATSPVSGDMSSSSGDVSSDQGGSSSSDDGSDDSGMSDDDGECEVEIGPFVADLTGDQLAGGIQPVFQGDVPPGTYREIEVKISPLADAVAGAADLAGASVVVNGSYTHQVTTGGTTSTVTDPFTISVTASVEIEKETEITVASDGSVSNVTLSIDWSQWFTDGTRALDPTNPADAATIAGNIARSLGAFRDDDEDGVDDDHEGGDGSGS